MDDEEPGGDEDPGGRVNESLKILENICYCVKDFEQTYKTSATHISFSQQTYRMLNDRDIVINSVFHTSKRELQIAEHQEEEKIILYHQNKKKKKERQEDYEWGPITNLPQEEFKGYINQLRQPVV